MVESCDFQNFLFDLTADPHETTNLWNSSEHEVIKAALIQRAEDLVSGQANDYGKTIVEFYERDLSALGTANKAFKVNGDYIVPWGCTAIP